MTGIQTSPEGITKLTGGTKIMGKVSAAPFGQRTGAREQVHNFIFSLALGRLSFVDPQLWMRYKHPHTILHTERGGIIQLAK